MKIDEFLSRLDGVTECAGGWMARCPAHGDSNPSLSVSERDGRILVHCHAGCTAQAVVESLGLRMRDLFKDAGDAPAAPVAEGPGDGGAAERAALGTVKKGKGRSGGHGKWVCDYLYQDATGKVIYRVSRYIKPDGGKNFTISRPNPEAKLGWSYDLASAGIDRVPYRLPRVVEASRKGRQIVILEGEKDVEGFEKSLGMVATCNPGGAMKWGHGWPEDWIKWFRGSGGILIVADNDPKEKKNRKTGKMEPHWKGQRHAWDVRTKLKAAGYDGPIRLITMPPVGGKPAKDFTEWAEARRAAGMAVDREAMSEAIREAGEWPEEWEFGGLADHRSAISTRSGGESGVDRHSPGDESAAPTEGAPAPKGGRTAASSDPLAAAEGRASGQGNGGGDASSGAPGRMGRFGAPVPRAPGDEAERYAVDFDVGGGRLVRLVLEYGWTFERIYGYALGRVGSECADNGIPKGVPARLKAWSAALWLIMRGSFFWHADHEQDFAFAMFLDRDRDECRLMRVMSNEFFAFIGKNARLEDIDPKRGDMAKILGLVKQIAVDGGYARGVVPGNGWERHGDAVYISCGDTEMCRVRDGRCDMVQNGTDGVVFLRGNTLAPWRLVDGAGKDPFAESPVFRDASWAEDVGPMNARLWVMNLFAQHRTKPILLVTGKAQSGKTRMARAIKEILGVRKRGILDSAPLDLDEDAKGREAFWVAVNNGKVEIFDNIDTRVRWVANTFQNASTGGSTKRRQLYSDDGEAIYEANASIIITSNNPLFATEGDGGMADRIISLNLLSRSWGAEDTLDADIAENRDSYLTWMARTLAKALADREPVDRSVNRRHPAYGEFSVRIGRAIGDEAGAVRALGAAEANKAILPLLNDAVARGILELLQAREWEWGGTSGELSELVIAQKGDDADGETRKIYSSRRVGKALNRYRRLFSTLFRMDEPKLSEGKTRYRFGGLTALGLQVVGLVDLEGDFRQSAGECATHGSCENNPSNPPNPPCAQTGGTWGAGTGARARASSPLPLNDEEGDMDNGTEDFSWDL